MAGAGTGKTSTLVARCIDCLSGDNPASLDELLVVTFTEAAATEARERIRSALETKLAETGGQHWANQLALFDAAHIGTLHSFCFQLVREHFYQLGLDPQISVLDEGRARLLERETMDELLDDHYAGKTAESIAVQELIETYGDGRDESIRRLVHKLHEYAQTRADTREWLSQQKTLFSAEQPIRWQEWLIEGVAEWRSFWLPELRALAGENSKAVECVAILERYPETLDRLQAAEMVSAIATAALGPWPGNRKGVLEKPLLRFFGGADFLSTLAPGEENDPLGEDWDWARTPMLTLLRLAEQFAVRFNERKQLESTIDFHDLEQLALQLLWTNEPAAGSGEQANAATRKRRALKKIDSRQLALALFGGEAGTWRPSGIADAWRRKIRFVFVDEYQDINAAQDRIISALSGEGPGANRFLVGDLKQSIYRFRLAEPAIFRRYANEWKDGAGEMIALRENFRSRPTILDFANDVFGSLMREDVGGVGYGEEAQLIAGTTESGSKSGAQDVEIRFRLTARNGSRNETEEQLEDLQSAEREARHIALRLRELKESGYAVFDSTTKQTRPVEWRDMAVLLRAPSNKAEGYAKQFAHAGVPLNVARGGFYESAEVADLLNLLALLDNPLQDVPLIAVLRSPLVALTLDELATLRVAAKGRLWMALVRFAESENASGTESTEAKNLKPRVELFLSRFARWRTLAQQASLSKCLEAILAETHYVEWLQAQERGEQCYANIQQLLVLAEEFDQFQRQGLFRFLRFIEAQHIAEAEPEIPAVSTENAVRLMSIHQSKGLEFPVVVVADLGKMFNFQDLGSDIILDEQFGLCPQVRPPDKAARYPSIAYWLAKQRQRREILGEELRLLYVAMTRAKEKLILTGSMPRSQWDSMPDRWPEITPRAIASARAATDWLRLWMAQQGEQTNEGFSFTELNDAVLGEAIERAPDAIESASESVIPELDDATFERLRGTLTWSYLYKDATERTAKTSVTALRRMVDDELESETERLFIPRPKRIARELSATDIGLAHHRFLENIALNQASSPAGLRAEAERLVRERVLSKPEAAALDFKALEKFWLSETGKKIIGHATNVRRELPFTARFAPEELDMVVKGAVSEVRDGFVIVQGIADLVVLLPGETWLLDFKTDELTAEGLAERKSFYAPQLQLYALALERIFGLPVTQCWLHFLGAGETIDVPIPARIAI